MPTDLEIAHSVEPRPIGDIAAGLGLTADDLEPYGRDKAKISQTTLERLLSDPGRSRAGS